MSTVIPLFWAARLWRHWDFIDSCKHFNGIHAHLFNHIISALVFQMKAAAHVSTSNYPWQAAVSDILHPNVRISMMDLYCQVLLFLLTACSDMVKLSAFEIIFLKLMKMLVSFNLYFSSKTACFGGIDTLFGITEIIVSIEVSSIKIHFSSIFSCPCH